ncbi:MAG: ABC transporter permease [Promethearchaeota archaeon]
MKYRDYVIQRFILLIPVMLGVSLISWFLADLSGDPLAAYVGENDYYKLSKEEEAAMREELGLNEPWYIRFIRHTTRLIKGDWGYSSSHLGAPVLPLLKYRFPATAELAIFALFIAIGIGIPIGIIQGVKRNQKFDNVTRPVLLTAYSIPVFVLALYMRFTLIKIAIFLGQYFNSTEIHYLFPTRGRNNIQLSKPPHELLFGLFQPTRFYYIDAIFGFDPIFFLDYFVHLFYPAVILGISLIAGIARMTRMAMIEVMKTDYILLAKAKGLQERVIIYRHALKNAMLPVLTVAGIILANLLTGSIFIEMIFNWPGIGSMIASGGLVLDMPLVHGFCILAATIYVSVNLAVDLIYGYIDPRIRSTM